MDLVLLLWITRVRHLHKNIKFPILQSSERYSTGHTYFGFILFDQDQEPVAWTINWLWMILAGQI